jgi:hypothetical protein
VGVPGGAGRGGNGSGDIKSRDKVDRGTPTAEVNANGPSGRPGTNRLTYGALRADPSLPGRMVQGSHWYTPGDHLRRYFEFKILFNPPLGTRQEHIRTVHIGNSPTGITLRTLIKSVRRGSVLRTTLLDTIPINSTLSALITLTDPRSAADYLAFVNLYPIRFTSTATAIAVADPPTFPMSPYISYELKARSYTRVLRLNGIRFTRVKTPAGPRSRQGSEAESNREHSYPKISSVQCQHLHLSKWLFAHTLSLRLSNTTMAREFSPRSLC